MRTWGAETPLNGSVTRNVNRRDGGGGPSRGSRRGSGVSSTIDTSAPTNTDVASQAASHGSRLTPQLQAWRRAPLVQMQATTAVTSSSSFVLKERPAYLSNRNDIDISPWAAVNTSERVVRILRSGSGVNCSADRR